MTTPIAEDVYILTTEIEILSNSEAYEGEGRMFCFVSCVCCATDKQDAIGKVKLDLSGDNMRLIRVEQIILYEDGMWEEKQHQEEMDNCVSEALETGEVAYSRFSCYHQ